MDRLVFMTSSRDLTRKSRLCDAVVVMDCYYAYNNIMILMGWDYR